MPRHPATEPAAEPELTLKQKAQFLAALMVVCAIGLTAALYPVFQQRAEAEKARVALVAKEKAESTKQAKIAAAKTVKSKKKRKGKMVKIALGQTKQADLTVSNPSITGSFLWYTSGPDARSTGNPGGWAVTEDGIVTPPVNPDAVGAYSMEIRTPTGTFGYEFEVVCMTAKLNAIGWTATP